MGARRRALISVFDKSGLVDFASALVDLEFELLSTGGTAKALREAGLSVTDVSTVTGFPEIMDGRVKTLHPAIHGGLLARRGVDDSVTAEHGIEPIELLVSNLYPFQAVTADPHCTLEDAIENIDIGGPAMIRAAAKNHERLTVIVDTADYARVLESLAGEADATALRRELAVKAFTLTASYDAAISQFLAERYKPDAATACPDPLIVRAARTAELRYGENPHQAAALYRLPDAAAAGSVSHASQLQGKELSYNNIADADAAVQCVKSFDECACVIVKHANPCGVALASSPIEAYRLAHECDPTSAFGGIIAFNRELDEATAAAILELQFVEVVVAPSVAESARGALAAKRNVRVLELGEPARPAAELEIKTVEGGLLVQTRDLGTLADVELETVTKRAPTAAELEDLRFAWTVAKYVKSNAIVYASGRRTVGIGAGQPSRVMSARIAALKAEEAGLAIEGAVMASDAYFPFRDGMDAAAEHRIAAVIQPGGSVGDKDVIAAADEHGMAMVFTRMRHFRH